MKEKKGQKNPIDKYKFIYHFLPHKHKKKRARLLTNEALITYALIQILVVAAIRLVPLFAPGVLGYASNINTQDLLKYTNETRAQVGLKPLQLNKELSTAALRKGQDMFNVGYWAHVSPLGAKPWDFILGANYDYVYAGENLAKNFSNSKDVVQAWYASPTHRENLLSNSYDDIGFAVINGVIDGYETTIVVQMFGRERIPTQLAVEPTPPAPVPAVPAAPPAVVEEETLVGSTPEVEEVEKLAVNEPILETPIVPEAVEQSETEASPDTPIVQGDVTPILQQLTASENLISEGDGKFIDIKAATNSITLSFGGFLVLLLGVDIWYSRKHGILKITGHTVAHLVFLAVILASVMLSIVPGAIL